LPPTRSTGVGVGVTGVGVVAEAVGAPVGVTGVGATGVVASCGVVLSAGFSPRICTPSMPLVANWSMVIGVSVVESGVLPFVLMVSRSKNALIFRF